MSRSDSLEYDRDGHLFLVSFPLIDIKADSETKRVIYTDQDGTCERGFSKYSEFIKFVNWIHSNG